MPEIRQPAVGAASTVTVCACATVRGGRSSLLRLSGSDACTVARSAGLSLPLPWTWIDTTWTMAPGDCPCRVLVAPAGRSFTGHDLIEVVLPGSPPLIEAALDAWRAAGAQHAGPGAFTRQALMTGRIGLDQAEGILRLAHAGDAVTARRALTALRGRLGATVVAVREDLLALRTRIETDIDFTDDDGVPPLPRDDFHRTLVTIGDQLRAWVRTAVTQATTPQICLVGPANAGKSALFNRLTDGQALVDDGPGTTRDWLEALMMVDGRNVRLVDTAGVRPTDDAIEAAAIVAGQDRSGETSLVLALSAPDAPLPLDWTPPPEGPWVIVATKADLGGPVDPRAQLAVSSHTGVGLPALRRSIAEHTAIVPDAEPRQQRLLALALAALERVGDHLDELAAEDLREVDDHLADLVGSGTPEEILSRIFAAFCIGK